MPAHEGDTLITYSQFVADAAPPGGLDATIAHVRAHLSSVAHPDDFAHAYAAEVKIERRRQEGGVLIVGTLAREPHAPYLKMGYDPWAGDTGARYPVPEVPRP